MVLLGPLVAAPVDAEAAAVTHHLRGVVSSDPSADPGSGYNVTLKKPGGAIVVSDFTTSGDYDLEAPDGTYVLHVEMNSGGRREYYRGAQTLEDADPIEVAGADVTLEPWHLPRLYEVSGRVEPATGVGEMRVVAYPAGPGVTDYTQEKPYYSGTFSSSQFRIELPAGTWKIWFDGLAIPWSPYHQDWAAEWYTDGASYSEATPVVVSGDMRLSTTPTLTRGGSVAGRVTDSAGQPLRKVDVDVLDADGQPVSRAVTHNDGSYVVPRVHSGSHSVRVADGQAHQYVEQTSGPLVVTDGTTVSVPSVALVQAPGPDPADVDLTGTVTDERAAPQRGIRVEAWAAGCDTDEPAAVAFTHLDGVFAFQGLDQAQYRLRLSDDYGQVEDEVDDNFDLLGKWYGDVDRCATSTPMSPGAIVDAQLVRTGGIAGTLRTELGEIPPNGQIYIHRASPPGGVWDLRYSRGGSWSFGDLPPGDYFIEFRDEWHDYVWTWWQDVGTQAEATRMTVLPGVMTTGVAGHVFNEVYSTQPPTASGQPVVGATLTVSTGTWVGRVSNYSYAWMALRGTGYYEEVGAGRTYVVQPADLGHSVYAIVTASGPDGSHEAASNEVGPIGAAPPAPPPGPPATGPPPTGTPGAARQPSTTLATGTYKEEPRQRRSRVVLNITVRREGAATAASGHVTVTDRGRLVAAEVTLVHGRARLVLRHPKARLHTYVVSYRGDQLTAPSSATVRVDAR